MSLKGFANNFLKIALSAICLPAMLAAQVINIDQAWLNNQDPTGKGPYYLDQADTEYILQTDISTPGTAFAMIASGVTLNLNGHSIIYDHAPKRIIANHSFEQGNGQQADFWDMTQSPNFQRYQGIWIQNQAYDGDYSAKITVPATDQFITNQQTVTLEPNVTYSLSAMFWRGNKPDVKLYVELVGQNGEPTRRVEYAGNNNRGIQYTEAIFKTGTITEAYSIRVGVEGASASAAGQAFVDDIKIQRYQTYGVAAGAFSWATEYSDITRYGYCNNCVIKNGRVIQGQDLASSAHGVFLYKGTDNALKNTEIEVFGADTSVVVAKNISGCTLDGNLFKHSGITLTNRDAQNASVVKQQYGSEFKAFNNIILGGPQIGFNLGNVPENEVYNNTIRLKVRYTNGFAIFVRGEGSKIYNNLIDNIGEYNGRGIFVNDGTEAQPLEVYNNTINVERLANSQEYNGPDLGGVYGIQAEGTDHARIYNNQVTAWGKEVKAYAFRANDALVNVKVFDNIFTAISVQSKAATLKFGGVGAIPTFEFYDNDLMTNDGIVGESELNPALKLLRNHITVVSPVANPIVFEGGWAGSNATFHTELGFHDSTYQDQLSRNYFENAIVRYYASGNPENRMAFHSSWSTTFVVKDQNGNLVLNATIEVRNVHNEIVFSGATDENGELLAEIKQLRTQGAIKTIYNDHTVAASYNGAQATQYFTADRTQTIQLQLGNIVATPSPSASRAPSTSPSSTPSASPSSPAGSKLDINNVSISEGNSGTKNLNFTVTLNPSSNNTVTVNYATSNLTAISGSDYVAKSGQLTFNPGQVSQVVSITINGDTTFESNETFRATLSNPVNASIQNGIGTGTILNDDDAPPSASPSASASISPSATPSPSQGSSPSASASIAPSSSPSASPSVPPQNGQPTPSASPGLTPSASPDSSSGLSVDDVEKLEGTERRGFARFRFSITLTEPSADLVFVTASTEDGTAQARRDYRPKSRTVTFSPGQTKKRFVVKVKSDRRKEDDEQFFITLSNPVNSALVKHQGTATIVDDD